MDYISLFSNEDDGSLKKILLDAVKNAKRRFWCVAPFVTKDGIDLATNNNVETRLITRLNDKDCLTGVMKIEPIINFIQRGGSVRFHDRNLHAKLWIADDMVYIGSANLTKAALSTNNEIMVCIPDAQFSSEKNLISWFERLWNNLGKESEIMVSELKSLAEKIEDHPRKKQFDSTLKDSNGLKDYGKSPSKVVISHPTVQHTQPLGSNEKTNKPEDTLQVIPPVEGRQEFPIELPTKPPIEGKEIILSLNEIRKLGIRVSKSTFKKWKKQNHPHARCVSKDYKNKYEPWKVRGTMEKIREICNDSIKEKTGEKTYEKAVAKFDEMFPNDIAKKYEK